MPARVPRCARVSHALRRIRWPLKWNCCVIFTEGRGGDYLQDIKTFAALFMIEFRSRLTVWMIFGISRWNTCPALKYNNAREIVIKALMLSPHDATLLAYELRWCLLDNVGRRALVGKSLTLSLVSDDLVVKLFLILPKRPKMTKVLSKLPLTSFRTPPAVCCSIAQEPSYRGEEGW